MATKKKSRPATAAEEKQKERRSPAHARLVSEYKAAQRAITEGERVMRAARGSLKAAGRTIDAIQKIDRLGAKAIVKGVKARAKARSQAAKRGWL